MWFCSQYLGRAGLALLAAALICRAAAAEDWTAPSFPAPSEAEQKIYAALEQPAEVAFIETPLADAAADLEKQYGFEIVLDTPVLDAVGIGSDTPITRSLKGIPLSSALRLLLGDLDLTYVVHDDVLLITTANAAREMVELRVYDVSQLLGPGASADTLGRMLSDMFANPMAANDIYATPESELQRQEQPPRRVITAYENLLLVRDNPQGQREISRALAAIGQGLANMAPPAGTIQPEMPSGEAPAGETPGEQAPSGKAPSAEAPPSGGNEARPESKP